MDPKETPAAPPSASGGDPPPEGSRAPSPDASARNGPAGGESGIPDEPEGTPQLGSGPRDFDVGVPVGPTPAMDFWEALYSRRSIRKFKPDPVPRELVDQVMHAGIWAPSSCNYQMWDLVAVDDPEINRSLAELSLQMGNAPVNIVVSYGRDFSEEGSANIQSASALIQNMSLAANVLGLGTFWITQMGDAEKVREVVGLPYDRLVIAVVAVGYPRTQPRSGPKRRPLGAVTHYNHYAGRAIPSSPRPEDWDPDLLTTYQRARVLNGLRHNKPRAWETRALVAMLDRFVVDGKDKPEGEPALRWLDVLPCTGILTEKMSLTRRGYRFDVVERSQDVGNFVAARTRPKADVFVWPHPESEAGERAPPEGCYDLVSCLYRLEDLAPGDREPLLRSIAAWVKPGGRVILGYVSQRSFHDATERMRRRRGGPKGVEYVLSPDPNIGPFQAIAPGEVASLCRAAGLRVVDRFGQQSVPQPEEIEFRVRNFSRRSRSAARLVGRALSVADKLPAVPSRFGRFQFVLLERS